MSKAKEQWESNECIDIERGCCDAYEYVKELEQQKAESLKMLRDLLSPSYPSVHPPSQQKKTTTPTQQPRTQ